MENINVALEIERLLQFGVKRKLLEELDIIQVRNSLMDLLKVNEPYSGEAQEEELSNAVPILERLLDYAFEAGIIKENTITYRDLLDARIMGLLMPRESEVVHKFNKTLEKKSAKKATDEFYALAIASNYIRMDRIEKNLYWLSPTEYGELEITVNLSKPEKDPKEIAASKLIAQSNYPKCLLCLENVGFAGHVNHPARQNHRVIPITIGGDEFYFQYSPYVYYNEHCIVFYRQHVPMKISEKTFIRLLDFIQLFPHYFIGSNADLPIVGGSILSHEHFQGGRHVFAMEKAPIEISFSHKDYKNVNIGIVKWPMSVIRLSSKNKELLVKLSNTILNNWKEYSDASLDILASSELAGDRVPHNTVTPIARENAAGEFEVDLVLRNNRTNEEHPDGIFHPHTELHHIKKENIGLIEVMGLAVLPARLNTELKEIEKILMGDEGPYFEAKVDLIHMLNRHLPWIDELKEKYGNKCSPKRAEDIIKKEIGVKFSNVLIDAGVFKRDERGQEGFIKFMEQLDFKK